LYQFSVVLAETSMVKNVGGFSASATRGSKANLGAAPM
jgi:hypothetical protein